MGGPVGNSPPDPRLQQLNAAVFNPGGTSGTTKTGPLQGPTLTGEPVQAQGGPTKLNLQDPFKDWSEPNRDYGRDGFDTHVKFNHDDSDSKPKGPTLESSDGTRYGIKGGKFTVTRELEAGQLRFEAGPKGAGIKFTKQLGGSR